MEAFSSPVQKTELEKHQYSLRYEFLLIFIDFTMQPTYERYEILGEVHISENFKFSCFKKHRIFLSCAVWPFTSFQVHTLSTTSQNIFSPENIMILDPRGLGEKSSIFAILNTLYRMHDIQTSWI